MTTHFKGGAGHNPSNEIFEAYVAATITSAQLLALNATPRTIVAAPGAGKITILNGILIHKPAGTAYADIAAGEDLSFKYTDGSGLELAVCETTGFLDQTTVQTRWVKPNLPAAPGAGAVTSIVPVANAVIVAQLLAGEITTGTSPLYLRVYYRVVDLTLSGT